MESTKFAIAVIFALLIFLGLGIVELITEKIEKKFKKKSKIIKMPQMVGAKEKQESHFYDFKIK